MNKYIHSFFGFVFLGTGIMGCSLSSANTYTGLLVFKTFDKNRTFDTTSTDKAPFYYRPVKIDLFYPSIEKPERPSLSYGDILDMYERRMNFNTTTDSCKKVSLMLAGSIAGYFHLDSVSRILTCSMHIYSGLRFPNGKHPLILYAASMNGSSWENPILFDSLVQHGYVVASISSVGIFPGYMSESVDLGEQVKDLLFAAERIKKLPFIDSTRIGLMGWSLGGSALAKAAMSSQEFSCLLSMDGTEIHYYGPDTAWDGVYQGMMDLAPWDPSAIRIPYLYLSSEHPGHFDSIYNLLIHVGSAQKYFFKFNKAVHEDFSSIISVAKMAAPKLGNVDSGRYELVCKIAVAFFNQYLDSARKDSFRTYLDSLSAARPDLYSRTFPPR